LMKNQNLATADAARCGRGICLLPHLETLRAAEDKLRIVCEWEAYIELTEARDAQHEALAAQMREHIAILDRICESHDRMESSRAAIAANEAKIAANKAEIAANKDRERVLWLRGIL
jgi:hypothetical protein